MSHMPASEHHRPRGRADALDARLHVEQVVVVDGAAEVGLQMDSGQSSVHQCRGVRDPQAAHEGVLGDLYIAEPGGEVDALAAVHISERDTDTSSGLWHAALFLDKLAS